MTSKNMVGIYYDQVVSAYQQDNHELALSCAKDFFEAYNDTESLSPELGYWADDIYQIKSNIDRKITHQQFLRNKRQEFNKTVLLNILRITLVIGALTGLGYVLVWLFDWVVSLI